MTFDEVVAKVERDEPDRKLVGRRVAEVIAAMGLAIDEATGAVVGQPSPSPWQPPAQQNVRYAGMRSRHRR